MRIIENGIEREATAKEIAIEKRITEEDSKLFKPESVKDYIEEFIDGLAEVNSITDIIKLAKNCRGKKNNDNS